MPNDEAVADVSDTVVAFNPSMSHRLTRGTRVLLAKDSEGAWVVIWADCDGAEEGVDANFPVNADEY